MSNIITIGKIVTASSQDEARRLFFNRRKLGLSGVIFTPDVSIPEWSDEDKQELTTYIPYTNPEKRLIELAGGVYEALISLSLQFNGSDNRRSVRFVNDNGLDEKPHRDNHASEGWVHWHFKGAGLLCASPKGDEPVQVPAKDADGEMISLKVFNRLVAERRIEVKELQPREAIVFDNGMVHLSGYGKRFRGLAFG